MENLNIPFVKDCPYYPFVNFNSETGICEIKGESYMEESYKFYDPLIAWIKKFATDLKKPLTMNFRLHYFNTNSSRMILDLLDTLREYRDNGGKVNVCWYYDSKDPDMVDEVEDFKLESGVDIQLIEN